MYIRFMTTMFLLSCLIFSLSLQLSVQNPPAASKAKYFVNSATCKMPYVHPFTDDVRNITRKLKFSKCRDDKDLVISEYDFDLKLYRLRIRLNSTKLIPGVATNSTIECKYNRIERNLHSKDPDNSFRVLDSSKLSEDILLAPEIDYIIIKCYVRNESNSLHLVQADGMAFVQDHTGSSSTEVNEEEEEDEQEEQEEPIPSVLIFGLESMSRINFRRTMHKSFKFVQRPGWHVLQGLNKVGDDKLSNMLALLTGHSVQSIAKMCDMQKPGCLDSLPFIWKHYKRANYTTAYAEDAIDATFNYLGPGFTSKPVDYYLRPLTVALEQTFKIRKYLGNTYCVGRHLSFAYVWDFAQQFVQRFVHKVSPMLGLFWSKSFTQSEFDGGTSLDELFAEYFRQFERDGLLSRSIVILLSDQGMRFGPLRRAASGYLEERMPLLYIYVPPWFRLSYPHLVANLKTNRNRLSSTYDLFMTLQHLLHLNGSSMPVANQCPTCQSLFLELPLNRTCLQAGIPENLCACHSLLDVSSAPYALNMAKTVVQRMNEHLVWGNLTDLCANQTLEELISLDLKLPANSRYTNNTENVYVVKLKTLPNSGIFEATFSYNNRTDALNIKVTEVSRLNLLHNDSKCIEDKIIKTYCICKDSVEKLK